MIHLGSTFKVDIFVSKGGGFDVAQLERRQLKNVVGDPQRAAYVATGEDTVLAKLDWYRRGNEVSERQWLDVVEVLSVQAGALDLEYLQQWAAELSVADLLEEALQEALAPLGSIAFHS